MRRYGIRALGLLLAVLLAAAVVLRLSDRPAAAEPMESAAETAPDEQAEGLPETGILVRSETAGETISLYSEAWRQLERLRLDSAGKGVLEKAVAGCYHLIRNDGSTLTFSVDEAGLVEVSGGNGWGNGQVLELTDSLCGSVVVRYHTQDEAAAACRLDGGGGIQSQELEPVRQEDGDCLAECRFSGLTLGQYQIYVGGDFVVTVSVTELSPNRTLELY
ncbi:MAG: hypothetical protein VB055_11645 [Oscillospiraceae bacterium]|nr:hypothetical protein [Oscillospiraceae bacterium]